MEAKEQFAGYLVVDCESDERAVEIAARWPDARFSGAMEVRPVMHDVRGRDVTTTDRRIEDLLRPLAPQVLGALVRRYGQFDACEDAVQEALLAAAVQWPGEGVPGQPAGLADHRRRPAADRRSGAATSARRNREAAVVAMDARPIGAGGADAADGGPPADDTLTLLFLCCHPALSAPSQVALTLRAVGGLTTAQIARAFLVPESTMAQRISRAKQRIKASRRPVRDAAAAERAERSRAVLHVLYLSSTRATPPPAARTCSAAT